MEKYSLITYDGDNKIISAVVFESVELGLDMDPYGDRCPMVVGSNQAIINHSDKPIYEAECAFCGNHGVCREYWKINLNVEIMDAFGEDGTPMARYGNPLCIDTCYRKIDRLMHTKHGSF